MITSKKTNAISTGGRNLLRVLGLQQKISRYRSK